MSTGSASAGTGGDIAHKIARLVEEKGWNQEDFARISNLNRHTVRQILNAGPKRRLRNATVSQCAEAFGFTVNELRTLPLDRLMLRLHGKAPSDEHALQLLNERAVLPELVRWLERHPERVAELDGEEIRELLELQALGGPIQRLGVEHVVTLIERRRRLLCRVRVIAASEHLEFLERFVAMLHEKVTAEADGGGRVVEIGRGR